MNIKTYLDINTIVESVNLADLLDNDSLMSIGEYVHTTYSSDKASRHEWEERYEKAQELAAQVFKRKNHPWPGASNVKHPLMSIAAMNFHARAYPALIPSGDIVTARTIGRDPDGEKRKRAERIGMHMSYQLLYEMDSWEEGKDKMLITLPITGCEFTKTYFNPETGKNQSDAIPATNLVVNYYAKDLKSAPRATEIITLSSNEIIERQRAGIWSNVDLVTEWASVPQDAISAVREEVQGVSRPADNEDTPFTILEQHNFLDLDGDGYKEPYIVTIEANSKKVLRIVSRFSYESIIFNEFGEIQKINPDEYYTKYSFIPSPDSGFYDMGFGTLLGPINESVNTLINQLIDSGSMNNLQAGFIAKNLRIQGGNHPFKLGEWRHVNAYGQDIRHGILPLPTKEPSGTLFNLLVYLVEAGEKLTSTSGMMMGENPGQNQKATTTMAVLDQGQKVFTAIYKRVRRSLGEEFLKLYRLNARYLNEDEQFALLHPTVDEQRLIETGQDDYREGEMNIFPSADPNMVSQMQRLARAQFLLEMSAQGGMNTYEVKKRVLDAMDIEDIDVILPHPSTLPPPPDYEMMKIELEAKQMELDARQKDFDNQLRVMEMRINNENKDNETDIKEFEAETKRMAVEGKIITDAANASIKAKDSAQKGTQMVKKND